MKKRHKRYYLGEKYPDIYFTTREMDVASLLLNNLIYQEMGRILKISPRTVEYYARRIRIKLGCNKKSESVQLLRKIKAVQDYVYIQLKKQKII